MKVSGDITTTFVDRNDFDLGMTNGSESHFTGGAFGTYTPVNPYYGGVLDLAPLQVGLKHQNVFVTQTRLRVDADLSDNVSTTVGLINERAWGGEGNFTGGASYSSNQEKYRRSALFGVCHDA